MSDTINAMYDLADAIKKITGGIRTSERFISVVIKALEISLTPDEFSRLQHLIQPEGAAVDPFDAYGTETDLDDWWHEPGYVGRDFDLSSEPTSNPHRHQ